MRWSLLLNQHVLCPFIPSRQEFLQGALVVNIMRATEGYLFGKSLHNRFRCFRVAVLQEARANQRLQHIAKGRGTLGDILAPAFIHRSMGEHEFRYSYAPGHDPAAAAADHECSELSKLTLLQPGKRLKRCEAIAKPRTLSPRNSKRSYDSVLSCTHDELSLIHISEPTRLRRISY